MQIKLYGSFIIVFDTNFIRQFSITSLIKKRYDIEITVTFCDGSVLCKLFYINSIFNNRNSPYA